MVKIPRGEYHVGAPDESLVVGLVRRFGIRDPRMKRLLMTPERKTRVRGFLIDKFEVTNAEYARFLRAAGQDAKFAHPDEPQGKDRTPRFWKVKQLNDPRQPVRHGAYR